MHSLKTIKINSNKNIVTEDMIIKSLNQYDLKEHFSITDIPAGMIGLAAELPGATVVFDLAGSSLSIRENGAKEYAADSQDLFRSLSDIIYENRGIIEKFPGDGISMHFPAISVSSKKAIKRAHHAIKTMDNYLLKERKMQRTQYRFTLTFGNDTIVTKFGNNRHEELISIGHAVNVAHKLEKLVKEKKYYIGMDSQCREVIRELESEDSYYKINMPLELRRKSSDEEFWYGVKY